jgi:hypothetical protein
MQSANEQLALAICDALVAEGLLSEAMVAGLAKSIATGKIKAEDWYIAVEESIRTAQRGHGDGRQDPA